MSRILVVYCSRSGRTQQIAQEIAADCAADLELIGERIGRGGWFGYLRSALEAALRLRVPIRAARRAPKGYKLVIIGTPVWFWNVASPVRSYLMAHRDGLRRVAFFCTCGGSGSDKVLRDLQRLCGRAPVATLALSERQLAQPGHRALVAKFVRELEHRSADASTTSPAVHI